MKFIYYANIVVNISLFWHDHSGISTKKQIHLRLKLLKKTKCVELALSNPNPK